jgi:peptidase M23-like protein
MSHVGKPARCLLTTIALIAGVSAGEAQANSAGGARAPSEHAVPLGAAQSPSVLLAGGTEYGLSAPTHPVERPVVGQLQVPRRATPGRPPRVTLRIDERRVGTVQVRVTVNDLATGKAVIVVSMGWVRTARAMTVPWPTRTRLRPGSYHVSVAAHDHRSRTLLRRAHSSGVASLTVSAPASAPPPLPTLVPALEAGPAEAGVPTPAQSAAAGAVFPVAGPHSFGGPENRFGAPRGTHVHQGQDVLTSEGTPIVTPFVGTVLTTADQAAGAGYYAVEHTTLGFDFMFAHCKAGSLAVATGQLLSAGQPLCQAGQTGDATTPHLHLEMWIGGWQAPAGHPIDPLPYLQAWDPPAPGA